MKIETRYGIYDAPSPNIAKCYQCGFQFTNPGRIEILRKMIELELASMEDFCRANDEPFPLREVGITWQCPRKTCPSKNTINDTIFIIVN